MSDFISTINEANEIIADYSNYGLLKMEASYLIFDLRTNGMVLIHMPEHEYVPFFETLINKGIKVASKQEDLLHAQVEHYQLKWDDEKKDWVKVPRGK